MTTQQAKHTPGPWHLEDWRVCGNDAEQSFICGVYSGAVNPHREAEARKNAALILAAPDMLAEMRRFMPVLERLADSPLWNDFVAGLGIATINAYRAAISRAGEA